MAISNDVIYGDLARTLQVHGQRLGVLANNLANADTPGFKARDIDFKAVLQSTQASGTTLQTTHQQHLGTADAGAAPRLWRVPSQPSADGNSVDAPMEQARFAEASLRYEATLRFVDGRVRSLLTAITGQ